VPIERGVFRDPDGLLEERRDPHEIHPFLSDGDGPAFPAGFFLARSHEGRRRRVLCPEAGDIGESQEDVGRHCDGRQNGDQKQPPPGFSPLCRFDHEGASIYSPYPHRCQGPGGGRISACLVKPAAQTEQAVRGPEAPLSGTALDRNPKALSQL